ncbi:phytanoyl-CoA dioxygenase family protein [Palleronia sp. KMU-117]|uniref:phytanoyl-CoA dioxygenase family protein n=1 Tax=Palleronia sp. KMU-117 TaxID=3434108 RepID=UPI003D72079D
MIATGYFDTADCRIDAFRDLIDRRLDPARVPMADRIEKEVPVYRMAHLDPVLADAPGRRRLLAEWAWVLGEGPGVLALEGAARDTAVIDRATDAYLELIAREKAAGAGGADHFAAAGANDRLWNSLQKLCDADAELFALYFGNTAIDAVSEAWLGPGYQMTAQVNLVHPGGAAQEAHRDYHLGFQTAEAAAAYPAHVHDLSPVMTLQGAVAHCDMPVESGPTKLLPFSQLYRPGYLAYRLPEFRDLFEARCIQVPLSKGDAVFFNPALFHAAGTNCTADIHRMANLLQVSSAFGRAMESIDRTGMCRRLYPALQGLLADGRIGWAAARAAVRAAAEGYAFPTNLDTDSPTGGLAPETQATFFLRALDDGMTPEAFDAELLRRDARRVA